MTHIVQKFVHGRQGELKVKPRRPLKGQLSVATRVVISRSQRKVEVKMPVFKCQEDHDVDPV